ncbi:MAG: hypothetical protein ACUVRS_00065 [Armatimonadota bacterium]
MPTTKLEKIGVRNFFYRGNYLTIEARRNYVSLFGNTIIDGKNLMVRVLFRNAGKCTQVFLDGQEYKSVTSLRDGSAVVVSNLSSVKIEIR